MSAGDRVCIVGIWHLGSVASACLAELGYSVRGVDPDPRKVEALNQGLPPLFEPGLEELMNKGIVAKKIEFSTDLAAAVQGSRYVLIAHDTAVDEQDEVDLSEIMASAAQLAPHLERGALVIVSSQVPVGTCEQIGAAIHQANPSVEFSLAYVPENLRLGQAIQRFLSPEMIIIGANEAATQDRVEEFLRPIQAPRVRMDLRSAEMAKHALNAFLATSISFANEVANLCDAVGADALKVAAALRLDGRIGAAAPLRPGLGFGGGTLARDLKVLQRLGERSGYRTLLLEGVLAVNERQNELAVGKLKTIYPSLQDLTIGILGLTYKAGTSTLRRSAALEIMANLAQEGALLKAYDPKANRREVGLHQGFQLCSDPYAVARGSDALILVTDWPEFRQLDFSLIASLMRKAVLLDCQNMLDGEQMLRSGFIYLAIGRGARHGR